MIESSTELARARENNMFSLASVPHQASEQSHKRSIWFIPGSRMPGETAIASGQIGIGEALKKSGVAGRREMMDGGWRRAIRNHL